MKHILFIAVLPYLVLAYHNPAYSSPLYFTNIDFDNNTTLNLELPTYPDSMIFVSNVKYDINVTSDCHNIFLVKQFDFSTACANYCHGKIWSYNRSADPVFIQTFTPGSSLNATFVVDYDVYPNDYDTTSPPFVGSGWFWFIMAVLIAAFVVTLVCTIWCLYDCSQHNECCWYKDPSKQRKNKPQDLPLENIEVTEPPECDVSATQDTTDYSSRDYIVENAK